jgi:hypothetical protein
VICELIAVVTRTSKSLGLGWRNHVMALGNGWTAWAVAAILVDGLHSYFGAESAISGSWNTPEWSFTWLFSDIGRFSSGWRSRPGSQFPQN